MESHVDPFLVEALENPRHRLTVLRMELDIQKFMQSSDQHQFEFQQLQTSYLRRIAHRVAQHYGLQTFSFDNAIDGSGTVGSKVIASKTPESKFPAVCLSAIPAKQTENRITDQLKITICQRPSKSLTDRTWLENRRSPVRTVEERKEDYEKARARIFNSSCSTDVEGSFSMTPADGRSFWSCKDELECYVKTADENEKARDAASRVATFRDREKDRWDPDYDRSYNRYVRNLTSSQNLGLSPCNVLQPPFVQYDTCSRVGQLLRNQTPISYRPSNPAMTPLCAFGCNQISPKDVVYHMQWPSPPVVYAQSYGHFKPAIFQAPAYQQSLIFDHSQNC